MLSEIPVTAFANRYLDEDDRPLADPSDSSSGGGPRRGGLLNAPEGRVDLADGHPECLGDGLEGAALGSKLQRTIEVHANNRTPETNPTPLRRRDTRDGALTDQLFALAQPQPPEREM